MPEGRRLLIVSDTPMWVDSAGRPCVYEATLREVESLARVFPEITWIGYRRQGYSFGIGRPPLNPGIKLIMLKASGGESFLSKVVVFALLPYYFITIGRHLISHYFIHTRGPSVPAFIGILVNAIARRKKFWHKFAGNWEKPPGRVYAWQRSILTLSTYSKVTINGNWPGQPSHILSFENACFTEGELSSANVLAGEKSFEGKLKFCFVGRLEEAKGLGNLLIAVKELPPSARYHSLVVVGDGTNRKVYEELGREISFPVNFKGGLNRNELNSVYAEAHLLILPSRSEGFPKVVSEGFAFGCIPIVTDISSLHQYVRHGVNGFLLTDNLPETIRHMLMEISLRKDLKNMSDEALNLAARFTYERFTDRIAREVFEIG